MKNKSLFIALVFLSLFLTAGNLTVRSIDIEREVLRSDCDLIDNMPVRHYFFNVPADGECRINIDVLSAKHLKNDDYGYGQTLYKAEYQFAGFQRILHLELYPVNSVYGSRQWIERVKISIDFESSMIEYPASELTSFTENSNYQSRKIFEDSVSAFTENYLKIEVDSTGIYRIDRDMLADAGMNPDLIDPGRMALFTPDTMYNYDSPDLFLYSDPVRVSFRFFGNGDNVFDKDEYILFFGENTNRDNANHYRQYDIFNNPYTDNNVYFLAFNRSDSKRAYPLRTGLSSSDSSLLYDCTLNYDSLNPLMAGYGWVWKAFLMTPDSQDTEIIEEISITEPSDSSGILLFKMAFESRVHYTMDVYFNDELIETIEHDVYGSAPWSEFSVDVGNVRRNNTVKIIVRNIDTQWRKFYLREIRLSVNADLNRLTGDVVSREIPSDIMSLNPVRDVYVYLRGSNDYLGIARKSEQTNIQTGDSRLMHAGIETMKPRTMQYISTGRIYSREGCDIIVITGNGMRESAAMYKKLKEDRGLSVNIFEVNEIYNAFSFGLQYPPAIKSFIRFALLNWDKKPRYVFFLGSASYDYKNRVNPYDNHNVVPVFQEGLVIREMPLLTKEASNVSDRWFCNVIGDDNILDIMPGRITALDSEEARFALMKIVDYEKNSDLADRNRVIIMADDEYSSRSSNIYNEDDFMQWAEMLYNILARTYHCDKIFLSDYIGDKQTYEEHWPTDPGEKRQVTDVINSKLNDGADFFVFYGHGANYTLAHEHVLMIPEDKDALTNRNKYPVSLMGTCNVGQFDMDGEALAPYFQKVPGGGFSASLAASRATGYNENTEIIQNRFFRDLLDAGYETLGEFYNSIYNNYSYTQSSYMLFGDPAMNIGERRRDIEIIANDTLRAGSNEQIKIVTDGLKGNINVTVYQPEYIDSHDYTHTEPYQYIKYVKTDGIIYTGIFDAGNDTLILDVPMPLLFDERKYNGKIEITAVSNSDSLYYLGMARNGFALSSGDTASYQDSSLLNVYCNNIPVEDSILLPGNYKVKAELMDKRGIYSGNIDEYKPLVEINGEEIVAGAVHFSGGTYTITCDYNSNSSSDTVRIVLHNNDLKIREKTVLVKHISQIRSIENITLYPNPSAGISNISFLSSGAGVIRYSVADRRGSVLRRGSFFFEEGFNTFRVNLDESIYGALKPGVYTVKMEFENFGRKNRIVQYKKLIKAE
ncbi:MAG: C25 family cysteine peptidase [bacterium]